MATAIEPQMVHSLLSPQQNQHIYPNYQLTEVLTSASEKAKLFAELFSKNSNLDDSGHELLSFSCRTDIGSSKASSLDGIPVVVLKNCEPELSFILTDLFNLCLKESCFPDCWKVLSVVAAFKNVGERSDPKNYQPISLLSMANKVFEKLINDTLVRHLPSVGLFSDSHYGFISSRSTADHLTVVTEGLLEL